MAATITGAFVLLDRASGTLKKIERQAIKTQTAIESLGTSMDKANASTTKSAAASEKHSSAMRDVEKKTRSATRELDSYNNNQRKVARGSEDLVGKLGRMGAALGGIGRLLMILKFGALAVGITALVQAVGALAGGLVALVPALVQTSGALAALPAVIGAAIQGVVTFKAALAGVMDAVKAGIQQQVNMGRTSIQMADQHRQAANSIVQAEHGVMLAQRESTQAQQSLNDARREAQRQLVDMRNAAIDAALGERGASLSLRRARQTLAQAAISPGTSDLTMAEDRLAVRQAKQQLKEAHVTRRRAVSDNARTQRRGVSGNRQLVQAQQGVSDAMFNQTQATFQLNEAQRQANQLAKQGSSDNQAYAQALSQLPPVAQAFAKRLVGLRGVWKDIQASAARGLIPGLNRSLTSGLTAVPMLKRVLGKTGKTLGNSIADATADMTTPARLGDLEKIGNQQSHILGKMVHGTSNLAQGLVDFMVSARPFTRWLTNAILGWTKWVEHTASVDRANGRTADFLDKTKAVLQRFGRILSNVWVVLRDVGRAAEPLGDKLWDGAEKATGGWKDFMESTEGAAKVRVWFDDLYAPLHALGQLTKDLAGVWARVTVNPTFTQGIDKLDRATPGLEKLMNSLSDLLPSMVETLSNFLSLLGDLPLSPLKTLLKLLDGIMKAVDWLVRKVPGLGSLLSGLLLAGAIGKSITLMSTLIGKWRTYLGMQALSGGGGGFMPGGGFGRGRGTPRPPMSPGTGIAAEEEAVIAGGGGVLAARALTPTGRVANAFRASRATSAALGAGRLGAFRGGLQGAGNAFGDVGGARGLVGGAAGKVARFAKPLYGLSIGLGAFSGFEKYGGFGGATYGATNAMDFGTGGFSNFFDPGKTQAEVDKAVPGRVASVTARLKGENRRQRLKTLRGAVNVTHNTGEGDLSKTAQAQYQQMIKALLGAERQKDVTTSQSAAGDLMGAFGIYDQHGTKGQKAGARKSITRQFVDEFKRAGTDGRAALGTSVAGWIHQLKKGNDNQKQMAKDLRKALKGQYEKMGDDITVVNGNIFKGTTAEWKGIASAMRDPVEKAKEAVTKGFTDIEKQAIGSLMAMGFDRTTARQAVNGMQHPHALTRHFKPSTTFGGQTFAPGGAAKGARIPGSGLHDTVPVAPGWMAAPGELIVNRHTEARVAQKYGVNLGAEVAGESRPHYMAKGGRVGAPNFGGHPTNVTPGIARLIGLMESKFPLSVTSTTDHSFLTTNGNQSDHTTGHAVDLSADPGTMQKAANWIMSSGLYRQLKQGIHNPNLSINAGAVVPSSFWGPATWSQHLSHLHLALAGGVQTKGLGRGGGGLLGAMRLLRPPSSGMGGVPGMMADSALSAMTAGANQRIRAAAGAVNGAGGGGAIPLSGGMRQFNQRFPQMFSGQRGAQMTPRQVMAVAQAAGFTREQAFHMAEIAHGESNYYPGIQQRDPGDGNVGYGLWQMTPHAWGAGSSAMRRMEQLGGIPAMFNPVKNAQMAKYLFDAAGGSYSPWYGTQYLTAAQGGRVGWGGWNAKGGTFDVNGPTLFGAGESGSERVHIVPKGRGGGDARPIHINVEKIVNNREGDIKEHLKKELEMLREDLMMVGMGDDS